MRNSTRCPSNGTKVFIEANHLQEGIKIAKCASLSRTLLDSNIVVSDCKILVDNTTYENNGWKRLWKTQEEVDFLIEKDPHGYEVVKVRQHLQLIKVVVRADILPRNFL